MPRATARRAHAARIQLGSKRTHRPGARCLQLPDQRHQFGGKRVRLLARHGGALGRSLGDDERHALRHQARDEV